MRRVRGGVQYQNFQYSQRIRPCANLEVDKFTSQSRYKLKRVKIFLLCLNPNILLGKSEYQITRNRSSILGTSRQKTR